MYNIANVTQILSLVKFDLFALDSYKKSFIQIILSHRKRHFH